MSQCFVRRFSDPYSFYENVHGTDISLVLKDKSGFRGDMTQVKFPRMWITRYDIEAAAATIRSASLVNRIVFSFPADFDQGSYRLGSLELRPGDLLTYGPGIANYFHISGPRRSAALIMTHDDLVSTASAITGREPTPPSDPKIIRPATAAMSRLLRLHAAVGRLAKASPNLLDNPAVINAVEQQFAHIVVRCLTDPMREVTRSDVAQHIRVIRRFEDYIASRQYEPVYLAEICAGIGVSERYLRTCCHEHLGIGPIRYLWLRRMNLVHRKLLRCDGSETTVTETATEFGFWELGRFSGEYRALFGEVPSATLRRPPHEGLLPNDPLALN